MNLHSIVYGAIGTVNPHVLATLQASQGYTTLPDGTQVPNYDAPQNVMVQVQALSFADLKQIEGLNITGDARAIYLAGDWRGVVRPGQNGGDLITIGTDRFLVAQTLEQWPDWTKLVAVLQV
ncbi:hypothetical protein EOD42_16825 [Rhodovarius crocodyli]|uniref:Uncharacterized protein n=1 Tax=Rhodovarius crocodyli TaxID=1979269 RepID=A0A437MC90_9PROT|nr:hypothetical protein [Rhodovarius crocodyli]RVT95248.1 hypothetical protein EOD42_16825 [Rhodovarius crocodyli]